jgi:hypothetical protein
MTENNKKIVCADISPEAIKLVIARLETVSSELFFSSGDDGESYSRDEMMKRVAACDEVGRKFVLDQLEFLRAIKDGSLLRNLTNAA